MRCPKCSNEAPEGAAFCPSCGSSFTAEPVRSKKFVYAVILAGVLLLVIIGALAASMFFARSRSITQADSGLPGGGPSVTNAPAPNTAGGPSVTNAPPPASPPSSPGLNAPKIEVPKEVLDYLEFVKQVESKRQQLLKDTTRAVALAAGQAQADSLMDLIDMTLDDSPQAQRPKRAASVENEINRQYSNWLDLIRYFDSKSAPQQCADFAGSYRQVLTSEANGISVIGGVLSRTNWADYESVKRSLQQLQDMKNDPNLQGRIDAAVESADSRLSELCRYYNINKPFDVRKEGDIGGSIISGGF